MTSTWGDIIEDLTSLICILEHLVNWTITENFNFCILCILRDFLYFQSIPS
jgi:hypothetical protein